MEIAIMIFLAGFGIALGGAGFFLFWCGIGVRAEYLDDLLKSARGSEG